MCDSPLSVFSMLARLDALEAKLTVLLALAEQRRLPPPPDNTSRHDELALTRLE